MQHTHGRVPRVGLAHGGRLVDERVLGPRTAVTVGRHPTCTLVLPEGCPVARHALLVHHDGAWHLNFDERMTGRVGVDGQTITLRELVERDKAVRKGQRWQVRLADRHRGRIAIGEFVVLFQFVEPTPVLAGRNPSFRPRLVDRDDPVFLGLVALNTVAAAVLQVWIWNQVPLARVVDIEHLSERLPPIVHLVKPVDPTPPPPPPPIEVERDLVDTTKPPEPDPEPGEPAGGDDALAEAEAAEALELAVVEESALLRAMRDGIPIFTRGEGDDRLRVAMDAVRVDEHTRVASLTVKQGVGVSTENATIEIGRAGLGGSRLDTAQPEVEVISGEGREIVTESARTAGQLERALRALRPRVQACYERVLKLDGTAEGRVELYATVSDGLVESASVRSDLHDLDFDACVERAIYDLDVPAGADAEVMYPFVLTR